MPPDKNKKASTVTYADHELIRPPNKLRMAVSTVAPQDPNDDPVARAERALPPSVLSYVAGGAGSEHTQRANVSAFAQWGLIPRMFVGASQRDLSVELFGMRLPSPLLMAPIGVIGLCAQDGHGDLATADAAARTGVPMIASTLSADPMEDVAPRFGETPGFFQLYTPTDRDLAASLVSRAEAAGFRGIVVTLDTWVTGWRPRDLAASNFPQLRGHCLANYTSDPVFQSLLGKAPAIVVAAIDDLEERGLVTRTRDPADRRRSRVTVTRAGSKALAHADELAEAAVAELFAGLDMDDLRQLRDLLARSAVRGRGRVSVLARPVALPRSSAVVGRVKPRAFENDAGSSSEQSLHFTATPLGKAAKVFGTFAQRLVAHGLEGVEVLPAFLAGVFISGHR